MNKIIDELKNSGIAFSNVYELFDEKEMDYFKNISDFFDKCLTDDNIQNRIKMLINGTPIKDKKKFYELTHQHYLNRALGLDDFDLINLYLSDKFLDIAKGYLGEECKIRNVLAWIHPQNPFMSERHSQCWHRDQEDYHNLKIFIYFSDIKKVNGALQYVKCSSSDMKNDYIWPNMDGTVGNLNTEAVSKIPIEDTIIAEGDKGTIVFVDTNGFHKGGLVQEGIRMLTQCCYLKPDAHHIKGVYSDFNYDKQMINFVDYDKDNFLCLSDRKKRAIK